MTKFHVRIEPASVPRLHPGGPGAGYQQNRGSNRPPAQAAPPPPNIQFYKDDGSKNLHPDLLTSVAEGWAQEIQKSASQRNRLTSHQLRRFYHDVKDIEKQVKADPGNFEKYWPLVGMIKAKVAYACNPKNPKVPNEFRKFMDTCIERIQGSEPNFKAFCLFFEAVVGYLYGLGIADN